MMLRQTVLAFGKIPFVKYFFFSGRKTAATIGTTNFKVSSHLGILFGNDKRFLF